METPKRNLHLSNVQEPYTPFKVPASPLMKSLGYGTGVNVYYLDRSPRPSGQIRSPWAIKRVSKRTRVTNKANCKLYNERILKEADILRKINHPNIVGFRAITHAKGGIDILALECCETSLGIILEKHLEDDLNALPAHHTKRMMVDISCALDYLHTKAKMMHGDIKSHNVLVKGEFEICKLCDFGVCLPLNEERVVNFKDNPLLRYVGTDLWSAPEVFSSEDVIDAKAEIFSFGLVIYETIALVPPHTLNFDNNDAEIRSDDDDEIAENLTLIDMACGTRPPLPQAFTLTEDYNMIVELFYLCTNACPDDRPSAKIIYESLTKESL